MKESAERVLPDSFSSFPISKYQHLLACCLVCFNIYLKAKVATASTKLITNALS